MHEASTIPRRLDDPPRMFWWDLDVALLVMTCLLTGMVCGFLLGGAVVGVALASLYSRAKSGRHPAYALHLAYWHLPAGLIGLKRTPPSHLRRMAG